VINRCVIGVIGGKAKRTSVSFLESDREKSAKDWMKERMMILSGEGLHHVSRGLTKINQWMELERKRDIGVEDSGSNFPNQKERKD